MVGVEARPEGRETLKTKKMKIITVEQEKERKTATEKGRVIEEESDNWKGLHHYKRNRRSEIQKETEVVAE